ncbi:MAG TPA: hypothetical protein VFA70_08575 [Dehalococcoidia bacterium]|nr:hypothetical protein [Dehalococcoidia bacterium]
MNERQRHREQEQEEQTQVDWGGPGHDAQEAINEGNADILRYEEGEESRDDGDDEQQETQAQSAHGEQHMAEQGAEPAGAAAGVIDRGTRVGEGLAGKGDMLGGLSAGAGDRIGGTKVSGDRAQGIEVPEDTIHIDMTR